MKSNNLLVKFSLLFVLLQFSVTALMAQLPSKLDSLKQNSANEIPNLSGIKELKVSEKMVNPFKEKYALFIEQPIDHKNPALGTFKQRVVVMVADYNAPTVIITEGYNATYGFNPAYREEVSSLLNTNIVLVEHRYFIESTPFMQDDSTITPESLDWSYMTAKQHAADLHNVNQLFRKVFPGKWIATGISKGGQTAMFYTAYYPKDVDVSVPYVGPLCKGVEDGRHEPFLENFAGTEQERATIYEFQKAFLERREGIRPFFEKITKEKGYTYKISLDAVYDMCVLEFPFAFWQWGLPVSSLPNPATATDEQMFTALVKASGPDYFAEGSDTAPFFVQAAKELGYYGYDTKQFKGLLTVKDTKNYLKELFLPQSQDFKFESYLYKDLKKFLSKTDSKMMFIYGEFDPWSAVMPVAPVKNEKLKAKGKGRENMVLFVDPRGSHRSRISTLPKADKERAISTLKEWLEIE